MSEVALDHTAVAAAASALREQAGALQEATERVRYAGAAPAGAAEQVVDGTGEAFGRHGARLAEALATLADALDAQRDAVTRTDSDAATRADRRYVL